MKRTNGTDRYKFKQSRSCPIWYWDGTGSRQKNVSQYIGTITKRIRDFSERSNGNGFHAHPYTHTHKECHCRLMPKTFLDGDKKTACVVSSGVFHPFLLESLSVLIRSLIIHKPLDKLPLAKVLPASFSWVREKPGKSNESEGLLASWWNSCSIQLVQDTRQSNSSSIKTLPFSILIQLIISSSSAS